MVKFTLEKDLLQNTLYKTIGTTGKREQRGGGGGSGYRSLCYRIYCTQFLSKIPQYAQT